MSSEEHSLRAPSDAALIRLAGIAALVEELMALDYQAEKAPVGLKTLRNDRRRKVEAILLLLADPEVRSYLAELKQEGLLPAKG
ncbi:MAG TPA: hypothetical protein VF990_10285 [Candidatus Dormibacteraeota bacterium]